MEILREEGYPKAAQTVTISSLIAKVAAYGPEGVEELLAEAYGGLPPVGAVAVRSR